MKIFGINFFNKNDDKEINIKELEEKCRKVKEKLQNPLNDEFHNKLKELLNTKINSRDNFINWVTGLTTGAMFLIFANISSLGNNKPLLISTIGILFLSVISAMFFKIFLEVRYSNEEIEVEVLKILWEGKDAEIQIKAMIGAGKEVSEKDKKKLYKNINDSVKYLDDGYLEKLKAPITIKSKLLTFFYNLTVFLFFLGIILTAVSFIFPILQ